MAGSIRHAVWPTEAPPVGTALWCQSDWDRFEDRFRPKNYEGGRFDVEAWNFFDARRSSSIHRRLLRSLKDPHTYDTFLCAWETADGFLRLCLIEADEHDEAPPIVHEVDCAPECAQQRYLRLFYPQERTMWQIPVYNSVQRCFTSLGEIVGRMEELKGYIEGSGWRVRLADKRLNSDEVLWRERRIPQA